jgi:hypothetical protein
MVETSLELLKHLEGEINFEFRVVECYILVTVLIVWIFKKKR